MTQSTNNDWAPTLRIACYGYAEPQSGSVSSASHLVLRRMLARGHRIDFFGKRSFAYPLGLEAFTNFRYVNVEGRAERTFGRSMGRGPRLWRHAASKLTAGQTARNIPAAIAAEHARRPYDLQLYLGEWSFGRVPGLPTVSWVQGPPGTDSRSIARHAGLLVRLDGLPRYAALRAFAAYRATLGRPHFRNSDLFVCGSRWAASRLRPYLLPGVPVETLPYPVDLDAFRPDTASTCGQRHSPPEVLWLGRSVPRKRLDLYLAACERLIATGRDLRVRVIGGFGFAPGFRRLLTDFRYPDRLIAADGVPRDEVPDLLRQASVLVQPSEEENFGSSVAEALACGTAVVVGPTNGTSDYVGGGGVAFDTYTPESVAAATARVLDGVASDPAGWTARTRSAAEAAFDADHVVVRLERILRDVIRIASPGFGGQKHYRHRSGYSRQENR